MNQQIAQLQEQILKHITGVSSTTIDTNSLTASAFSTSSIQTIENGVDHLLRPNAHLPPAQALAIYQRAYIARLLECLRADYPVLRQYLGTQLFDHFATEYIQAFPPTSYSLFDLGKNFSDHLEQSCPDLASFNQQDKVTHQLPIQIAVAERLRIRAARAIGLEQRQLIEPNYHNLQHAKAIALSISDACGLMSAHPALLDILSGENRERDYVNIDRIYLAISRSNYRIRTDILQIWQYHFLHLLAQSTQTPILLEDLVMHTSKESNLDAETIYAHLSLWLPIAISRAYLYVEFVDT
ncbi:HvfC/BufC N-terminal domain-containing protein [Undibacterium baiyunense]|uniref:DNA-binding domain-containing protein n=1 Tax=Undibacterium baiyunense TaxID=2828731 RepID=A0A941DH10_9BURK|nr:DNA-binding domain-containing protein [Undibacterium baiyunense]MBR7746732.1 putative DNA-binding domain-containing protein [Undibacterium baiyunense]